MGRKEVQEHLKKTTFTIAIPKWQIDELRKIKNYNQVLADIIGNYLKNSKNVEK